MERKCTICGTWNLDNDFCTSCGKAISPIELEKIEVIKRQSFADKLEQSIVDKEFMKYKNSKNVFVRQLFKIMYSFWVVYMAIISFMLWLIALVTG